MFTIFANSKHNLSGSDVPLWDEARDADCHNTYGETLADRQISGLLSYRLSEINAIFVYFGKFRKGLLTNHRPQNRRADRLTFPVSQLRKSRSEVKHLNTKEMTLMIDNL